MDIGANLVKDLRYLRLKNGLSQQEIANRIYVSKNTISDFETGQIQCKVSMVEDYARALGVKVVFTIIKEGMEISDE